MYITASVGVDFIEAAFEIVAAVTEGIGATLSSLVDILWTSADGFTTLGYLVLLSIAAPIAMNLLNFVLGLFRKVNVSKRGK